MEQYKRNNNTTDASNCNTRNDDNNLTVSAVLCMLNQGGAVRGFAELFATCSVIMLLYQQAIAGLQLHHWQHAVYMFLSLYQSGCSGETVSYLGRRLF